MSDPGGSGKGSNAAPGAGAGITGGYNGNSLALKVVIAFFAGLSMYNAIELIALVFITFVRYNGVYFWSLLIASRGVVPYSLGFVLKFFEITTSGDKYVSVVLLKMGWYTMVTGQNVVLWSRLHLLLLGERGTKILKWTKYMMIIDAVILHIPTTILTFGCNGNTDVSGFVRAFNIYEKVQMVGFLYEQLVPDCTVPETTVPQYSLQELILSSIYLAKTLHILCTSFQPNTRKLLYQLFTINILIILMDISLLAVEFANLYIIETTYQGVVYSIKLKLEFAVLGKLVLFISQTGPARSQSVAFDSGKNLDDEVQDFVDTSRSPSNITHAAPLTRPKKKTRADVDGSDLSLAHFEHV